MGLVGLPHLRNFKDLRPQTFLTSRSKPNALASGRGQGKLARLDQQRAVGRSKPVEWSNERRREYIEFCTAVVQNSRGTSPFLEAEFNAAREMAARCVADCWRACIGIGHGTSNGPAFLARHGWGQMSEQL